MAKNTTSKKITKKTAPKTSEKARSQVKSLPLKNTKKTDITPASEARKFKFRKAHIILVIVMFALGTFLYYGRGLFVAAVVNGKPISRISIVKEAEKQAGKSAMERLVVYELIEQEAKKKNIVVSAAEIDEAVKQEEEKSKKQGRKFEQDLALQGLTMEDFRRVTKLRKIVEKAVGGIEVTDKEVSDYLEKNRDSMIPGQTEEQLKQSIKMQLEQQKLGEKAQAWIESLRNKAKILYFVQY